MAETKLGHGSDCDVESMTSCVVWCSGMSCLAWAWISPSGVYVRLLEHVGCFDVHSDETRSFISCVVYVEGSADVADGPREGTVPMFY